MTAKKPDNPRERRESNNPKMTSNIKPERKTLFIFATLFSLLYWAEYFIMAMLMPQSRNVAIRAGAERAIEYSP